MKIAIPKPCHENWSDMLPGEQGRFCLKCTKTVVDFSAKSKEEIKSFFKETTEKVCGRFKTNQVDFPTKTSSPPRWVFPSLFNLKRIQKFAFALYLVFGTFLFSSCADKTKVLGEPKVEYIKGDVAEIETPIMGKVIPIDTTSNKIQKVNSKKLKQNKEKVCIKPTIEDTSIVEPQIEKTIKGDVMIKY